MSDEQDDNLRAIANWAEDMKQRMAQRLTQELAPLGITVAYEPVSEAEANQIATPVGDEIMAILRREYLSFDERVALARERYFTWLETGEPHP